MRLPRLPFLRSTANDARPPRALPTSADDSGGVEAARTRARRRLGGALLLLALGVVIFPIVFETQPRPLPVDTPITLAAGGAPAAATAPAAVPERPAARPPPATSVTTTPPEPALPKPPPTVEPVEEVLPMAPQPRPSSALPVEAPPLPTAPASASTAAAPASGAAGARFVVQVGAYTDPATLREARSKVERLGMKTYTQVVASDAGPRTRVRLGPFDTRDEAEAAAGRVKRAGMPANVLAL